MKRLLIFLILLTLLPISRESKADEVLIRDICRGIDRPAIEVNLLVEDGNTILEVNTDGGSDVSEKTIGSTRKTFSSENFVFEDDFAGSGALYSSAGDIITHLQCGLYP